MWHFFIFFFTKDKNLMYIQFIIKYIEILINCYLILLNLPTVVHVFIGN